MANVVNLSPYAGMQYEERPCSNKRRKKVMLCGERLKLHFSKKKRKKPNRPKKKARRPTSSQSCIESLMKCFKHFQDPRINRRRRHLLIDIIVIAICGVICNANTWKDIAVWAETHHKWLSQILELPNGIPSRDTLRRTISRMEPKAFQQAFLNWAAGLRGEHGNIIAIDGKTLRATKVNGNKPLHIVSAWATAQHLTLGQVATHEKSNEITAIPKLLETLQLKGAIVTIDAMGCQKAIAQKIIDGKGDYCLAAKGNQETLARDVAACFENAFNDGTVDREHRHTIDAKRPHGRHEERHYYTLPVGDAISTAHEWPGLKSIGMTITYRAKDETHDVHGDVRYYIMSFASDVDQFATAARGHWGIENSLHWVMDLTFREDDSRIRKDYGGENVSWLRRLAITLIKNETTLKDSIRSKRIRAGYDPQYLEKILAALPPAN